MINKEKIVIMTKMAIYDKNFGEADRSSGSFFRHDYIYWKNFWARLSALFGCAIVVAAYVLDKIVIKSTDLFAIDYKQEGIKILTFVIVVLGIITFFNSIKATREYSAIEKRIASNLEYTKKLDRISASERGNTEEIPLEGDLSLSHGTNTNPKRSNR